MVVGFTTTCAISSYSHFEFSSLQDVLNDTTLCDKVCQWLVTGWWFSPGTPVSSTNKNDCHGITVIFLKVALNTINQTKPLRILYSTCTLFIWRIVMSKYKCEV